MSEAQRLGHSLRCAAPTEDTGDIPTGLWWGRGTKRGADGLGALDLTFTGFTMFCAKPLVTGDV